MYKIITGTHTLTTVSALALTLALGACGGGGDDESLLDKINNGGTGASSSSGSNSSQPNTTDVQQLGYGSGENFQAGVIGVGIGDSMLSAGGTTTLTVNIVSNSGDLVTEEVTVTFNSPCIAATKAQLLLADGSSSSSVTTTNGEATITYLANGCVDDDRITATASYQGSSLSAASTLTIGSDIIQTITFESASNSRISLKGTGSGETSVLTFQVLGSTGAPMENVDVNFSLNTSAGGANLTTTSATTNSNGRASTTLQAGTIAATARVTAKALGTQVATQSNPVLISTGIPDQKSMTLSAESYNPDSWRVNGVVVPITVQLADAFNNPPPEGTYVTFTTSSGSIDPGCETEANGSCSVDWRSGEPRHVSGQLTILAHTPGNESFIDTNGNGWYDVSVDSFASGGAECSKNAPSPSASGKAERCDDLGDAYLDKNYNDVFDGDDTLIDFDPVEEPGYSESNGKYNGALCPTAEGERDGPGCTTAGVTIRKDLRMVMSSEKPELKSDGLLPGQESTINVNGGNGTFVLNLADINGNSLPAGTEVSINLENAKNVTASRPSVIITNTQTLPSTYTVTLDVATPPDPATGSIRFDIAVPGRPVISTNPTKIL